MFFSSSPPGTDFEEEAFCEFEKTKPRSTVDGWTDGWVVAGLHALEFNACNNLIIIIFVKM